MCGIAGAYQQDDGKVIVAAMTDRLAHRGPDARGVVELVDPTTSVVLGHRRLSIIDPVSASDQPLVKDGIRLVYNGEVYNYRELRTELEATGVRFATASDTEVVLEAWRAWGNAGLARLRGMFALAVHDERSGHLTLARDPFGIKPLYVLRRGTGIVFASELKAVVEALGSELAVDPAGMVASTLYYWLPTECDAVRGVRKLEPGTWSEHRPDGSTRTGVFCSIAEEAAAAAAGPPVDLAATVEDSVRAHLVADVPVATFLSGGLDSSIITALAHRHEPGLEAWTIGFRAVDRRMEAMPDDAAYARRLARHLGVRLHEIEIGPDVVSMLPQMVDVLDEPVGDPAAINTYLMCEAARTAGVEVLLSGTGADELFGGYRKHLANLLAARYRRLPEPLRTRVVGPAVERLPVAFAGRGVRSVRWAQRFVAFAGLPEQEAFRRSYTLHDPEGLRALLDPELGGQVDQLLEQHRATYEDTDLDDHVARMCLADARMFLPGLNLTYTDRASMAASTEVRVPFVDIEVLRAAFAPQAVPRIDGRVQKAGLKTVARSWLPDEIIDRPKASFGAPLRAWTTHDLRPMIDDLLLHGELVGSGFLRSQPLTALVDDQRSGRRDRSQQIWQLLSLELWFRNARGAGVGAA